MRYPQVSPHRYSTTEGKFSEPLEILTTVTEHLKLTRFFAIAIHPQGSHHVIHRLSGWFVLMEKIASKQYHIGIALVGQAHDFMEGFPAIVAANMITFVVSDMIVCCYQNINRVGSCVQVDPSTIRNISLIKV